MYLGLALLLEGSTRLCLVFLPPAVTDVLPSGDALLSHHCVDDYMHVRWQHENCVPHADLATLNVTLRDCLLSCQSANETELADGELYCGPDGDR